MSKTLTLFSPSDAAHAMHCRRSGNLELHRNNFRLARREFREAIQLDPDHVDTITQLGLAWEADPYGSDRQAAKCFRHATRIEPTHARAWAMLARAAVRIGRERLAMHAVRKAVRLAPTHGETLSIVVEALRELGRLRFTQRVVTQAQFLAPRDRAIRQLADYVRFETARQQQRRQRGYPHSTSAAVLPFVRLVRETGESVTIRRDAESQPLPHIARFRKPRA